MQKLSGMFKAEYTVLLWIYMDISCIGKNLVTQQIISNLDNNY